MDRILHMNLNHTSEIHILINDEDKSFIEMWYFCFYYWNPVLYQFYTYKNNKINKHFQATMPVNICTRYNNKTRQCDAQKRCAVYASSVDVVNESVCRHQPTRIRRILYQLRRETLNADYWTEKIYSNNPYEIPLWQ